MPRMMKRKWNLQTSATRPRVMKATARRVKTLSSHNSPLKKGRRMGSNHVLLTMTLLTSAAKAAVTGWNALIQLQYLLRSY